MGTADVPASELASPAPNSAQSETAPSKTEDSVVLAGDRPGDAGLSCERIVARIGRNHGHVWSIAATHVRSGASASFQLRGTSDHDHRIEILASEFEALGRGEVLRKYSERGGGNAQRHRVLLRCEPLVLPAQQTNVCRIQIGGKDDHELVIPEAHVRGSADQKYDIQGVAGHTHQLIVKSDHFARLVRGEALDILTEPSLGHFHHVYISYPMPA
jgi:hypothetical protein